MAGREKNMGQYREKIDELMRPELLQVGIALSDTDADKFAQYMALVLDWNQRVNLTRITEPEAFILRHFVDSVTCIPWPELVNARRGMDVGTGAGFPGLPLAMLMKDCEFVLLDTLRKRVDILREIIDALALTNVHAIHGRAEEVGREETYRAYFDLCVSRAVANLSTLSELALPFVCKGGWFFAYKGADAENEVQLAQNAVDLLGGVVREVRSSGMEHRGLNHKIVLIEKTDDTPEKYPRRPGLPEKRPLGQHRSWK